METKEEIGIVISTIDSPSTSKVVFVSNNKIVHKGTYIQIDYSEGHLIGQIMDVVKKNRYFENSESIKDFDSNQVNISDKFPILDWEFLECQVKPLGVYKNKRFIRTTMPVSPGTKVYVVDKEILFNFLHFSENGLNLGKILNPELNVKLDLDRFLQKHLAILAQSGSGKSYLTSVILEELLERGKNDGRIASVLFDTHGEYYNFTQQVNDNSHKDYSKQVVYVDAKDIMIGCSGLSSAFFGTLLPNLSRIQLRELSNIINKLKDNKKQGGGPYSLDDIIREVSSSDIKENVAKSIIGSLYELKDYNLFSNIDSVSVSDVVFPGKLTIIDLSKEINKKKKQIILFYFANQLFYGRYHNHNTPPFFLIVEEAHQYAPEKSKQEYALAKNILETIAREGRKFGASLCLISQRPVKLSTTILSQANTHIILKITNPYDLAHIGQSSEGLDSKSIDMITGLRVGEALIVGEACSYPVFFSVRQKKSMDSHMSVSLSNLAKNFEFTKALEEKDIDSFL